MPVPTATHLSAFHATPFPLVKIPVAVPAVQSVVPLTDHAILVPPSPTATNLVPVHATPYPAVVKIVFPRPVHDLPSYDHAIVCVVP